MEWLYKNAGIGQHSLLLQEPTKAAAVRKGCRVGRHANSPAKPKNQENNDNWNDWEAGDAWEPVTTASSPAQKSSSKAKASASKSSSSTKQGSSKSSSAKSPTSKLSPTKSLSSKKKGDEKLLIDFGEESAAKGGGPSSNHDWDSGWDDDNGWEQLDSSSGSKGYQRISTKAD